MWLLLGGNGPGGWLVASHCCFPVVVVVGAARQFAGQVHAGTEGCATFDSLLFRLWLPLPACGLAGVRIGFLWVLRSWPGSWNLDSSLFGARLFYHLPATGRCFQLNMLRRLGPIKIDTCRRCNVARPGGVLNLIRERCQMA